MSIAKKSETGKGNSFTENSLAGMAAKMDHWIRTAAAKGWAFHEFESEWHEMIHRMANIGTGLFISQQGDGDLGQTVTTDKGVTQSRTGESPVSNGLRVSALELLRNFCTSMVGVTCCLVFGFL